MGIMKVMRRFARHYFSHFFVFLVFVLAFIALAPSVAKLRLYIDDFSYALDKPSLLHNFPAFFVSYTITHGLYRPLALIYYFIIYSIYFISPAISHLIPFSLHALSGYILYRVLHKQGLMHPLALLAGLLYVLHPFATEQYMWLSANPGTVTSLLFLVQLALIYYPHKNQTLKLALIFFLSLISPFIYESTFFFFIPLAYLYIKTLPHVSRKKIVQIVGLLFSPLLLYGLTKILIKGQDPRPLVDSIPLLWNHVKQTFDYLYKVHLWSYYPTNFWTAYRDQGWTIFTQSPMIQTVLIFLFFAAIIVGLFIKREHKKVNISALIFWLLTFAASLIPLFANKEFYFGFRTLFLPVIFLIICFFWIAQKMLGKNAMFSLQVAGVIVIGWFILVDFAIVHKYESFYNEDMALANKINAVLEQNSLNTNENSVFIFLQNDNFPDSRQTFLHADHMLSCFFYNWSSYSCMKAVANSIAAIGIQQANGNFTLQNWINKDDFFQKKPFVQLRYTTQKELIVEMIIRN